MKVRLQKKGLQPPDVTEEVQSVVLYDSFGNPIFVAQQHEKGTIITERAGAPGFEKMLKALGIGLNSENKVFKV